MVRRIRLPVRLLVLVSVTLAVSVIAALSSAAPASAIAHGEPVPEGRFRFNTRLVLTVPGPAGIPLPIVCSGALVAPSWIITAGHCFVDAAGNPVSGPVPYPTTATVGQTDLTAPVDRRHVSAVTEVRQAPGGTDIALGRLARPITDIAPLALATTPPPLGLTLRIVGWGATNSVFPLPTLHLQTGLVTVASVTPTTIGVRGLFPAPDTSACLFDSGAPYFTEGAGGPRLVSVESDGPDCPHDQVETTARVDTVAWWITRTIGARR